jgi:hypothetical protein
LGPEKGQDPRKCFLKIEIFEARDTVDICSCIFYVISSSMMMMTMMPLSFRRADRTSSVMLPAAAIVVVDTARFFRAVE